jgi:hypothetical protein
VNIKRQLIFDGCGTRYDQGPRLDLGDTIGKWPSQWTVDTVEHGKNGQSVWLSYSSNPYPTTWRELVPENGKESES